MGDYRVHHVRFFDYQPQSIQCMSFNHEKEKLALARSDGTVEIWDVKSNWYQEQVFCPVVGESVEALVWCSGKLFSAGLHGHIHELNLVTGQIQSSAPSNSGAIWCLAKNESESHIVAGTEDGCVVVFKLTDEGIRYERAMDKQEGRILSIAWHSAENLVVTGGADNIRLWSASSGHAIQRLTLGRQERGRETIVWCVAITPDLTIVSGDSRGKTSFWNAKQGTLIKSFQSHKADVLAMDINKEGTSVYCSGVDPVLIQFEFIAMQPNSDWKVWVQSNARTQHTHDVRAIAVTKGGVASGGVDCQLILNNPHRKHKVWRRIAPVPHHSLVSSSRQHHIITLMYPTSIEVWKLGSTSRKSEKNGEILALKSSPIKLLQLKAKGDERIMCSAISESATWLAYSDSENLRIFSLSVEDSEVGNPKVSLSRLRNLEDSIMPARSMIFTPEGDKLITITDNNSVQVIALESELKHELLHTLTDIADPAAALKYLAVSQDGKFLACSDLRNQVHIINTVKGKIVAHLPHHDSAPTAMTFHPTDPLLLVAHCDQRLLEYDFASKEYTDWSRGAGPKWHPQWLKRTSKISQVSYNPQRPHEVWVRDEQMLAILNKEQPFPEASQNIFTKESWKKGQQTEKEINHAFHICSRYKYLMHMDLLEDDFLLLVERPPMMVHDALPPSLKVKKYGT